MIKVMALRGVQSKEELIDEETVDNVPIDVAETGLAQDILHDEETSRKGTKAWGANELVLLDYVEKTIEAMHVDVKNVGEGNQATEKIGDVAWGSTKLKVNDEDVTSIEDIESEKI